MISDPSDRPRRVDGDRRRHAHLGVREHPRRRAHRPGLQHLRPLLHRERRRPRATASRSSAASRSTTGSSSRTTSSWDPDVTFSNDPRPRSGRHLDALPADARPRRARASAPAPILLPGVHRRPLRDGRRRRARDARRPGLRARRTAARPRSTATSAAAATDPALRERRARRLLLRPALPRGRRRATSARPHERGRGRRRPAAVAFGALADDYRGKRAAIDAGSRPRPRAAAGSSSARRSRGSRRSSPRRSASRTSSPAPTGPRRSPSPCGRPAPQPDDEVLLPANTCAADARRRRAWPARAPRARATWIRETLTLDAARRRARGDACRPIPAARPPLRRRRRPRRRSRRSPRRAGLALVEDCAQSHGAASGGPHDRRPSAARPPSPSIPSKNLGAYGDGGAVATGDAGVGRAPARAAPVRLEPARLRRARGLELAPRRDAGGDPAREAPLPRARRTRAGARSRSATTPRSPACRCGCLGRAARLGAGAAPLPGARSSGATRFREHLARAASRPASTTPCRSTSSRPTRSSATGKGDFPVSEAACDTVVSLPIYPTLTDAQVDAVVAAVRDFFEERRDERATSSRSSFPSTSTRRACRAWPSGCGRSPTRPTTTSRSSSWTTARATPPGTRIERDRAGLAARRAACA